MVINSNLKGVYQTGGTPILLSAFEYEPYHQQTSFADIATPTWQQKQTIKTKQKEIELALTGLGIKEDKFKPVIDSYFDQLSRLAGVDIDKGSTEFIEWVVNKPQIERITKIFNIVDGFNDKAKKLYTPIERFLSLVNRFLQDSSKEIDIDPVGHLIVKMKGQRPKSIESLSSGERQIVVMLAHLSINEANNRTGIFIVDEPELSLHLRWQEIFVDSILEASPSTQFILATHAPSIVLDRDDKHMTIGN